MAARLRKILAKMCGNKNTLVQAQKCVPCRRSNRPFSGGDAPERDTLNHLLPSVRPVPNIKVKKFNKHGKASPSVEYQSEEIHKTREMVKEEEPGGWEALRGNPLDPNRSLLSQ